MHSATDLEEAGVVNAHRRGAVLVAALTGAGAFSVLSSAPAARAAFPGPNGRVAFWGIDPNGDGAPSVYTADPRGGAANEVVPDAQDGALSPDGTKLVFVQLGSDVCQGGLECIKVANANGSSAVQVALGGDPGWSPDGTKIAFF